MTYPAKARLDGMYYCRACSHATPKDDWQKHDKPLKGVWVCPYCGTLQLLEISNDLNTPEAVEVEKT